jgi:hypothetical protein
MSTTAKTFSIKSENSWCGISFYVINSESNVVFSTATKSIAVSACAYLNNKTPYINLDNNKIKLSRSYYREFNTLITKNRLGRPLKKESLRGSLIKLNNSSFICLNTSFFYINDSYTSFLSTDTLSDIFKSIAYQKDKKNGETRK